uniref:Uncharacterized protein n=1 Tax=Oryza glumipatula TaxID=40148 RepID=A0A0E0B7L2_9ORYZ
MAVEARAADGGGVATAAGGSREGRLEKGGRRRDPGKKGEAEKPRDKGERPLANDDVSLADEVAAQELLHARTSITSFMRGGADTRLVARAQRDQLPLLWSVYY